MARNPGEVDMNVAASSYGSDGQGTSSFGRPGVLVFTSSLRLCFTSKRATELCKQMTRFENAQMVKGTLPLAVINLVDEIHRLLWTKAESKDWEQFQIRRVVGGTNCQVLLCGFGVVEADMDQSKIVIVLQGIDSVFWSGRVIDRSKERYQLTWRETQVLRNLF